jgi:hypothetical protein
MSYLNISPSSFGNSRTRVRRGYSLRKINQNLSVLAGAVLSALNLKVSDLAAGHAEKLVADTERDPRTQNTTQGCRDHLSEAEYQHLVKMGHWHHHRQRRRSRQW